MVQITSKELVTTDKQIPPAPTKWEPKKVIKYTGLGAAGLTTMGLAYSQLWETAQKVPSAVKTGFEVVKKIPETMDTLNDSYEFVTQVGSMLGEGINLGRIAANLIVEKPTPTPTTKEETTALGFQFLINMAIISSAMALVRWPLSNVIGKPGSKAAIVEVSLAAAQTAVPGILGRVVSCASSTFAGIKKEIAFASDISKMIRYSIGSLQWSLSSVFASIWSMPSVDSYPLAKTCDKNLCELHLNT